jgi:hypothetical protein
LSPSTRYYQNDQIKENGIGRTCSRLGWDEKYIAMLFRKPEGKGLLEEQSADRWIILQASLEGGGKKKMTQKNTAIEIVSYY